MSTLTFGAVGELQNVAIEYRYAENQPDRLRALASPSKSGPAVQDLVMIVSHHRGYYSRSDGHCMFSAGIDSANVEASPRFRSIAERHVGNAPRQGALDPAGLILELEMAALIKQARDSLRQQPDREQRSWWRRFVSAAGGIKRAGSRQ